ncbi:hypothetical protein SAMN02982929_01554 [Saccharopolyspora kobensis]|uniref:Uncharacterized protein n=1 Tax=Saccharopolyspora kobensis TaxID=146035 RepID=A0A1H5XLC2_9PSEU|nr:hypothetical protein [Saccharopolyspora kobensis]SEG12157.1 hypothetical protein SAMN02982929_01554 [Saccharopolyspora kobensis]SFE41486.1 hypothetical protein SAMN05216506_11170 [Saccharopolyspora kobensis]
MLDEQRELAGELRRLVAARLLDPLSILLESDTATAALRQQVEQQSEKWAATMLGSDQQAAVHACSRTLAALFPGDGPFDPPDTWWRTPLGRVVARRVGHPGTDHVSFSTAGAILGITRQGVHDLVGRGKLERHPDGGVRTASIRARLDHISGGTA